MLNDKVEKLQATVAQQQTTVAQQQKQIEALTTQLREQAEQIQKVSAQLEMVRPAPRVVGNRYDCYQGALLEKSAFPRYIQPPREPARRLFFLYCSRFDVRSADPKACSRLSPATMKERRQQPNSSSSLESA